MKRSSQRSDPGGREKVVTMYDIAARAAVSQTTVSFVLNGRADGANIPLETRERVLTAARELGYQRNQIARAMGTGKSRILSVLTTPLSNENQARILTGAHEAANEHDYLVKVQNLSWGRIDEATIVRCLEWRLDGVILVGLEQSMQDTLYAKLDAWRIPLVTVDNARDYEHSLHITSDDEAGLRNILEHLKELGHHRLAFLGGRPSFISLEREQIFRRIVAEIGLFTCEPWIRHSDWGNLGVIKEVAVAIFDAEVELPSAVVCASDIIAMIVIRMARARGLRVPEDLSVTGYSNSTLSSVAEPSLTTVEQPFHAMGYAAAMHLVKQAESSDPAPSNQTTLYLPTKLILRESTAPYKAR